MCSRKASGGLAAVVGALAVAGSATGAAAASPATAPSEPPARSGVPDPPNPSKRPEAARVALQLVNGRVEGRRLTLVLRCGRSGRLELNAAGRSVGARRFMCRDSRARLSLDLPGSVARRAASGRGMRATATASVGGWRTSFTLKLGHRTRYARASFDPRWTIQAAWCTNYGFQASIDTATLFSANYGEQVWWRPIGWQYETQSWSTTTYLAGYGLGSNLWDTYTAVPDNDVLIDPNTGVWTFYANAQVRSLGLWTTRTGVWVRPAIQAWTARGGYQWRYIRTTTTNGYGSELADWCYVPAR